MKSNFFIPALTVMAIVTSSLSVVVSPSYAQGRQGFYCDLSTGRPATMYRNSQGQIERWINWDSNFFKGSGYDPVKRCQEVSNRLESYRLSKQLKYVTVGMMNNQRVICTASEKNGRCNELIYTLKPGQDAVKTLYNFLGLREGQAGVPSLSESGEVPYIDVRPRLGDDATVSPNNALPVVPNVSSPQSKPQTPGGRSGDFQ